MKRLALAAALALAGCATGPKAPADQAAERGHAIARQACAACHATEPGGASPRASAPAFGSLEMRHTAGLEGRLADLARQGHYGMPPVKLDAGEVRDLLAYIESLAPR